MQKRRKKMSELNHYGKKIDSEIPVTGVINTNEIIWEFMDYDYICLTCEEIIDENPDADDYDFLECDSSHTKIHGDWIQDTKTGIYSPDKAGEYAMIENESTCQIVFSKTIARGNPCSPCFVGQVEFSNDGDFKAYTLPSELLYQDED